MGRAEAPTSSRGRRRHSGRLFFYLFQDSKVGGSALTVVTSAASEGGCSMERRNLTTG